MDKRRFRLTVWFVVVGLTLLLGAPALGGQQPKVKASDAAALASRVDLNTAAQAELEKLPGIGETTAKKIIAGRPYKSVGDLAKAGVPKATIEKLTPLVTVGATAAGAGATATARETGSRAKTTEATQKAAAMAKKVDLNTASAGELDKLPGIGEATAKKIIAGRPYKSIADLEKAGVPKATIEKIAPMVTVSGSAPAAAPRAATAPPQPPRTPAKSADAAKATTTTPPAPSSRGMVWVNTDSGIFHREGDRWYGKTKQGKYMTEADAIKEGYRESKQ